MAEISKFMAEEIADAWDIASSQPDINSERAETLRECADIIRMLANRRSARCPRAPEPFNYCPDCDGFFPCQLKAATHGR